MSPRSFAMAVVSVIAVVVLSPAAAVACRIDNDGQNGFEGANSTYYVDVWFDCGVACGNYFDNIRHGAPVSRPSKAGKVQAQAREASKAPLRGGFCELGNRVSVGAHGEVGVTLAGPNSTLAGPDGTEKFRWVSKGGNNWKSPISHTAGYAVRTTTPCNWRGTP